MALRVHPNERVKPAIENEVRHFISRLSIIGPLLLMMCTHVFSLEIEPEIFEHGLISTRSVEFCASFSSDMNEVYFVKSTDRWGKGKLNSSIYFSIKKDGKWNKPSIVSFSGIYNDSDPHLSKDGRTLHFISTRPSKALVESPDIWMVQRFNDEDWGKPERLPEPINSAKNEFGPTTTSNGDIYFVSDRKGGYGHGDIYKAKLTDEGFLTPMNLGSVINSSKGEWNLELSDDGKIMIFEASQRDGNKSSYGDLYISFKQNSDWTIPQNITEINTTGSDLCPDLNSTNETLSFSSSKALRNEWVNIYQVNFQSIFLKYQSTAVKE